MKSFLSGLFLLAVLVGGIYWISSSRETGEAVKEVSQKMIGHLPMKEYNALLNRLDIRSTLPFQEDLRKVNSARRKTVSDRAEVQKYFSDRIQAVRHIQKALEEKSWENKAVIQMDRDIRTLLQFCSSFYSKLSMAGTTRSERLRENISGEFNLVKGRIKSFEEKYVSVCDKYYVSEPALGVSETMGDRIKDRLERLGV